ncbi:transcriptional regulator, LacI family [Candidatus Kryptobacter tengchongensis]|nr:transcriptional regulator, LacI family [Candidatus Kryptobacter tengchongensis]
MFKKVTIKDVAKKAGLSISTVSLVINNKGKVGEETRKKVLQAIEELGYYPTRSARNLASRKTGNLGFILTEEHFSRSEPFYTKIFLGTEFESRTHNYYILLTTIPSQFSKNSIPRFLLENNVDGVIFAGKVNQKYVKYVEEMGIPYILVDYDLPGRKVPAVMIDNVRGGEIATEHLLNLGYKKIAFIGGDIQHPSIKGRFEGYKRALEKAGIICEEKLYITDEPDTRLINGFKACEKLFNSIKPDAIFAANDAMAIGCIKFLKIKGIKIPDDIAIVGFDDIEACIHIEPRLTTIRVEKEELGIIAVKRIVEMIENPDYGINRVYVPVKLVIRDSCGAKLKGIYVPDDVKTDELI